MVKTNNFKKDGFYITTPEFALMLNISTEALRSRRRRGLLKGQYVFDGKNCLWKTLRPNQVKEIRNDRLDSSRLNRGPGAVVRGRGAKVRRRGSRNKEHGQGTRTRHLKIKMTPECSPELQKEKM